jgi:hypothetical protein
LTHSREADANPASHQGRLVNRSSSCKLWSKLWNCKLSY